MQIVNVPYNTKITLSDTGRKDSGVYKIIAENEFGKDEATVEVTVLCMHWLIINLSNYFYRQFYIIFKNIYKGPPTRPQGPLKVKDVTSSGAKVKWDKPKDDGGKPVTAYVVEKMDSQTGRWIPVGRTQEPEMDVKGLQEGHEYSFRVKALNEEGESEALESDGSVVAKNPYGK